MRIFLEVAGSVFLTVAVLHFLRAALDIQLVIGSWMVPNWVSLLASALIGLLAYWAFNSLRKTKK